MKRNCANQLKLAKRFAPIAALAVSPLAFAGGSDIWFTPLTESAPVMPPNSFEELDAPWASPAGILQTNLLSLREVEDQILSPGQDIIRVPSLGSNGSMIDMVAFDETGDFLFMPHETSMGAGVTRFDMVERSAQVLFRGDLQGPSGDWSNDYGAFDPCRYTPNGTLFLAEEWSGQGRVIEVRNPFAAPEDIEIRELHSIANVSHEGINFSEKYEDTIYFVDEDHSGSIYKFVMTEAGDYTKGQTFVLSVDAFAGDAAQDFDEGPNAGATRAGYATWVPLSDENGGPLPGITNPFDWSAANQRPGRVAADDAGGTPYGRPEDVEVSVLRHGQEVIYFAATSESAVYRVEILGGDKAKVGVLVDNSTPKNLGFPATTGVLNSPDNLAQDALGNIYVIEDAPNGSATGGDIWFIRDANNDGEAESLDHFLSVRADGCEATGMIFNPVRPTEFVVAIQHPDSTDLSNVPNGLGDAVWLFDLSAIDNQGFVKALQNSHKRGPKDKRGKRYGDHGKHDHDHDHDHGKRKGWDKKDS